MNIGTCPHDGCDEIFMLEVPEQTPAYALIDCDGCGRKVWYRFSRINPQAWTQEAFEATHDVDHETHKIAEKG